MSELAYTRRSKVRFAIDTGDFHTLTTSRRCAMLHPSCTLCRASLLGNKRTCPQITICCLHSISIISSFAVSCQTPRSTFSGRFHRLPYPISLIDTLLFLSSIPYDIYALSLSLSLARLIATGSPSRLPRAHGYLQLFCGSQPPCTFCETLIEYLNSDSCHTTTFIDSS